MNDLHDLPETYLRFYKNLTPNKLSLYHKLVSELEDNATFMRYAHSWNKERDDAYLDHMYYTVNYKMCLLRDVQRLEWLDTFSCGRKQIILDIGCGTGYFSYFAAKRGHTVYSMDAAAPIGKDIFFEGQKALGLSMYWHTIQPFSPLLELPQPPSLAVAFSPHFYNPSSENFWREPAWRFFLKDLANRMIPGGTIYFHLNQVLSRPDFGPFGTPETRDLFLQIGTVDRNYICTINNNAVRKLA